MYMYRSRYVKITSEEIYLDIVCFTSYTIHLCIRKYTKTQSTLLNTSYMFIYTD